MSLNPENVRSGAAGQKTPVAGTCPVCGRPLTQLGPNGECLRCLFNWGLEGEQTDEKSTEQPTRAPTRSRYAHFEIEVNSDGFPAILGAGAMAVTYCARDTVLNSKVALKVISGQLAENPTARARFLREARAAAQIHHPNVARVMHYGEQDGECFYAMELVEGETLEARVQRDGNIPLAPALEIIEQTSRGLVAGEACGVVHRDLKPSNVMVESDPSGQLIVKIIDFGVAKVMAGDNMTVQTQAEFVGTPAFASPEQFDEAGKQHIDTRSDIYSLGVTLWYLLTGHTPFEGRSIEEIRAKQTNPLPFGQLNRVHAPASVVALLKSMLAVDPAKRPQTARDLLSAIRRCHTKFSAEGRSLRRLRFALTGIGVALVLAVALSTWSYRKMRSSTSALPLINEKSIAVLPFENRSEDKANAYLAEGIRDEILVRLSKIADLKVISHSSTEHYKSNPENLPEIAKELGVAHILEGSVQKSGDAVRVNVQLIKAANHSHLWADSYDRKLTDVFSVESDVAKATADQLQAKLTGQEEQIIAAKPTDNPDAYDAYMRGLAYSLKSTNSPANALGAQKYLKEAVRLDPKFALSWALLSYADARGYLTNTLEATIALREEARQAAETALTLRPTLGEAILAKGFYSYSCEKDYDTAVRYFEQARSLLPNSSQVPLFLAVAARRRGQWDQSESYFNEAERIDPRNVFLLSQHASSYISLRRLPEASRKLDQVLNIIPDDLSTLVFKAGIAQGEGDLARAAVLLAPLRPSAVDTNAWEAQVYQAILERHSDPVINRLKEILANPDPALGSNNGELRFWLGWAQEVAGDHTAAMESWHQARSELEPYAKEQPENFSLLGDLALTCAALGDKAAAFSFAEKAIAAIPIEKDPFFGPGSIEVLARVAAQMGEPDRAIAALQKLLSIPYAAGPVGPLPLTAPLLRLDPMFDPLRSDPRFQELLTSPPPTPLINEKSIAVLPFENRIEDKANAYFAEGIQDEILVRLSKIADLKVISRSSTERYKSSPKNVPEIAKELGVAHILEGSVQKSGDAVRVNVQLIKAASDSHLWADSFDRKLTDIFSVESEVAKAIADQLRAKLTGREEEVIAAKPTDNPDAYDAYMRGLAYCLRGGNSQESALGAQKYLREAVRLDPRFALSWALLSYTDARGYLSNTLQSTIDLREEARRAAETALTLQPNLGEAILAKGFYYYACQKDYDAAVRYFEQARPLLPNSSQIPEFLAYVTRRRGQWDRSEEYFNQAERIDPRNIFLLNQHANSYVCVRRFSEASRKLDQVLNINPDDMGTLVLKAAIAQAEGDLPCAAALLAPLRPSAAHSSDLEIQVYQAILERKAAPAVDRLKEILARPDPALGYTNGELRFWFGWAQEVAGEHAAAIESWHQARSELEAFAKEQPQNFTLLGDLALTCMSLGDKTAAVSFVEKGIAANPIEKDPFYGHASIEVLARVAAQMGEPDRAIATLEKLLSIPYSASVVSSVPLTASLLRLDPMFDPLRNDPRFQKLLASPLPKR